MYVLYKSKNILTLVTIGYIVGFVVGMYVEYCYGPKCKTRENSNFLKKGKIVISVKI